MHSFRVTALLTLTLVPVVAVLGAPNSSSATKPPADHFRLTDLLPNSLNPNPRIGVSVLTEMTPEGKALTPPDQSRPTYYAPWDGGLVEEGDTIGGEVPPKKERLATMMERALAASGYLPATAEHPASIVIYYRWGSYNQLTPLDAEDPMGEAAVRKNMYTRAALVGGATFAREMMRSANDGMVNFFRMRSEQNDELLDMATGNLYFVVAVAYDAAAARAGKSKKLWTTKISASSEGLAMDETLPALATSGRRLFGHETNGPVLTSSRLFSGKVEVGPTVVVGDGADTPAPTPQKTPAK